MINLPDTSPPSFFIIHCYLLFSAQRALGESKLGRPADALALGGDEGRDKLR